MGDHRAECHIQFTIHDKEYRLDLDWVNWGGFDDNGLDYRVREFFSESWDDAYGRYMKQCEELHAADNAKIIEEQERKELERLKAKYEQRP